MLTLGGGFLLAVLWMDLMFDVQVLRQPGNQELPETVLSSIAGYYQRVVTDALPMGYAIAAVMITTVLVLLGHLVHDAASRGRTLLSLLLCGGPILLALLRVVPNAARLGSRADSITRQSELARAICRDHVVCFAGMLSFVIVQLLLCG